MRIDGRPGAGPSLRWGTVAALLALAACGGPSTTSPTAPTKTDTFNGTLAAGGVDAHAFTVTQAGALNHT